MADDGKVVSLAPARGRPPAVATTIGRTGLKRSAGYINEEFLTSLQGRRGIRAYAEMSENDPVIGGFLFAITSVLTSVEWHAEPEEVGSAEDCDCCEFIDTCIRDLGDTWGNMIAEALSFLVFGWALMEVTWKKRNGRQLDPLKSSKFDDGRWGWRSFDIRGQDSLEDWVYDDKDKLLGMRQRPAPSYQEYFIPLGKSVLFRLNPRKQNPEGRSLLRPVYRPHYFKKRIQELEAIGVERNLAGLPVLYIESDLFTKPDEGDNAFKLEQWKAVVRNLKRDEQEGVVMPNVRDEQGNRVYELTLLSTGSRRQSDTNVLIQRYNAEIAMAALSDFMLLGHSRVGTFALGVTKTELFATAFNYVLDIIQNEINEREIPRLLALNAMPGEARLVHGKPGNVDLERFSQMVKNLVDAGLPVASKDGKRERFIFEQLGLPAGDIGEQGGPVMVQPPIPGRPEDQAGPPQRDPDDEDEEEPDDQDEPDDEDEDEDED